MRLSIDTAVTQLRCGHIIAYPTEAVYGLGCDPNQFAAVDHLLQLKQRPKHKGFILIAAHWGQLAPYIDAERVAPHNLQQALAVWPGAITWLFPKNAQIPEWLCADRDSIAVRVTAHPVARALCLAFGGALISTSANLSGQAPARDISAIEAQWGVELGVVTGSLGGLEKPTCIRDVMTGAVIR